MITAITRSTVWTIETPGFQVLSLTQADGFDADARLAGSEAVLLDTREIRFAVEILRRIRSAAATAVHLLPVFLHADLPLHDPYLLALADGTVETQGIPTLFNRARPLRESAERFRDLHQLSPEAQVAVRALRFMLTRNREIAPVVLPKSRFGYVYPIITAHFADRDDARVFRILDLIREQGAAETRFLDRQRLCPHCLSAFLNFREVCPKCHSADLVVSDLVHHFTCGHVAAEEEYRHEDQLVCPKCRKILRHIGLDYDKPSVVFTCRSCRETFQDPEVWGFCFYCEHTSQAAELVIRDIYAFNPSQTSLNVALSGMQISLGDMLRDKLRLVDYASFQAILAFEYEREKRYKRASTLVYVQIDNFPELSMRFGEKREEVALEMAGIIRETLRDSDVLSVLNESAFAVLLPETPLENTEVVIRRLQERLDALFASNLRDVTAQLAVSASTLEEWDRKRQDTARTE